MAPNSLSSLPHLPHIGLIAMDALYNNLAEHPGLAPVTCRADLLYKSHDRLSIPAILFL